MNILFFIGFQPFILYNSYKNICNENGFTLMGVAIYVWYITMLNIRIILFRSEFNSMYPTIYDNNVIITAKLSEHIRHICAYMQYAHIDQFNEEIANQSIAKQCVCVHHKRLNYDECLYAFHFERTNIVSFFSIGSRTSQTGLFELRSSGFDNGCNCWASKGWRNCRWNILMSNW